MTASVSIQAGCSIATTTDAGMSNRPKAVSASTGECPIASGSTSSTVTKGRTLIAIVTGISLMKWRLCPYLHRTKDITEGESQARLDQPFVAGPRFVLIMLAGIVAIIAGLAMVSQQVSPTLALLLIVLGVFAVQIEPAVLRIRESVDRVVAAQVQGPDQIAAAEERLRYAHIWLVSTNLMILIAAVLALLSF